jgi:hypothetical protein
MRMSTPTLRIQSGTAIQIIPSGSPDEKESSVTARVRLEERANPKARKSPSCLSRLGSSLRTPTEDHSKPHDHIDFVRRAKNLASRK